LPSSDEVDREILRHATFDSNARISRIQNIADALYGKNAAYRLCSEYGGLRIILSAPLQALKTRTRKLHRGGMKPTAPGLQRAPLHQILAETIIL